LRNKGHQIRGNKVERFFLSSSRILFHERQELRQTQEASPNTRNFAQHKNFCDARHLREPTEPRVPEQASNLIIKSMRNLKPIYSQCAVTASQSTMLKGLSSSESWASAGCVIVSMGGITSIITMRTPLLRQHQFTTYVVLVAEPTGVFLRSRDWTRSWVNDRESVLHCSDVEFHQDVNCHISCPTMIDDGIDPFGLPMREPIHVEYYESTSQNLNQPKKAREAEHCQLLVALPHQLAVSRQTTQREQLEVTLLRGLRKPEAQLILLRGLRMPEAQIILLRRLRKPEAQIILLRGLKRPEAQVH
jgi:hypothetical protein